MTYRCQSCSIKLNDKVSYEVHFQYAHTSDNMSVGDRMYDIPPEGHLAPVHLHQHQPTYPVSYNMMPASDPQADYARNTPTSALGQHSGAYVPYERAPSGYHSAFHNTQFPMSMPPTGLELPHAFNPARFGNALPPALNGARGAEPQSVLDLDSHKVLYNARPNGEESQDSSEHWSIDTHFAHHQQQQQQQQQDLSLANGNCAAGVTPNGRASSGTPLPSPDFNSVSTSQISSSDSHRTGRNPLKARSSNASWKSNEARRPKTYNCSACNKWFTSSGHLKRHYNTTLHKNAVKQSGQPDPAGQPVSAHHHPQKDPTYSSSRQQIKASPSPPEHAASPPSSKMSDYAMSSMAARNVTPHSFPHSPNLMAGPTEVPGGLLHHPSYTQSQQDLKSPSPITSLQQQQAGLLQHSNHTNYLQGFSTLGTPPQPTMHQFFHQPTQTTLYPNFKAPHVSTRSNHQVTQSFGNLTLEHALKLCLSEDVDDSKLPSFACIQKSEANGMWNAEQFISAFERHGNVGGSSDTIDNTANMLLCEIKQEPIEHIEEDIEDLNQLLTIHTSTSLSLPIEDTKVSSSTGSTSPVSSSETAKFRCDLCNKTFNKTCYLTQHNKSFHGGHRPHKCAKCGKRFATIESYALHSEKHAGNKPHKCVECPKAFNHKTDLRRHACLHSNTRPHVCNICKKGFIRKDHMIKHRDTHQNRRSTLRKVKTEKAKTRTKMVLMEVSY